MMHVHGCVMRLQTLRCIQAVLFSFNTDENSQSTHKNWAVFYLVHCHNHVCVVCSKFKGRPETSLSFLSFYFEHPMTLVVSFVISLCLLMQGDFMPVERVKISC